MASGNRSYNFQDMSSLLPGPFPVASEIHHYVSKDVSAGFSGYFSMASWMFPSSSQDILLRLSGSLYSLHESQDIFSLV